ncbi:MAG TPA: DUF6600 domain-containing protein [Pyrinomonadaceae bacterium]|jgi:hypothetical protein|nr:DUF6600 domain-containing protein [Pyrinomonadaceae bacterium]
MRAATRPFFSLAFLSLLILCGSALNVGAASPAQRINLPEAGNWIVDDGDDDTPEVTDRVARISFLEGAAKIKRAESTDWETVTLNLPLVEGDEIVTDKGARLEIQFDKNEHLRLAENSALKIVTLRDQGIALSLSLGTATMHADNFDKARGFFEIDAPKTTFAVEKAGTFRIDAGQTGDQEVRVVATGGGEAHVYSESAGFTLKNGRSTRVFIDGPNAGDWQTADATNVTDEFDAWSSGRDLIIAQRIKTAYYDKYYDDDIYGADDLNDYGDWVNTKNYGWVWRPSKNTTSGYADWSPYRYGHWRWMPPFGWVWVNDEPWGWATYHHGRWFYDSGAWYWSPYGYYRPQRSWWFPALVVINVIDTNVCWYPSGYHSRHHWSYWGHNRDHDRDRDRDHDRGGNGWGGRDPRGGDKPPVSGGPTGRRLPPNREPPIRNDKPPVEGVVGVSTKDFGFMTRGGGRRLPPTEARVALRRDPNDEDVAILRQRPVERANSPVRADAPATEILERRRAMAGAMERKADAPLDNELRTTRVFGGRPQKAARDVTNMPPTQRDTSTSSRRDTGAVERDLPAKHAERQDRPSRAIPTVTETAPPAGGSVEQTNPRVREHKDEPETSDTPSKSQRQAEPRPQSDATSPREQPRREPPVRVEPRREPREPPRQESQPREQPRSEPRSEPRQSSPPPQPRSEPKSEPKPQPQQDKPAPGGKVKDA